MTYKMKARRSGGLKTPDQRADSKPVIDKTFDPEYTENHQFLQDWRGTYYDLWESFLGKQTPFFRYLRINQIDLGKVTPHAGFCSVLPVIDCSGGAFEFAENHQDAFNAFIVETKDKDCEATTIDLVAWPLGVPRKVMSYRGRTGLLGLVQAYGFEAYLFDQPLTIHRTPLQWLQAGCRGATIVDPRVAAVQFRNFPAALQAPIVPTPRNFENGLLASSTSKLSRGTRHENDRSDRPQRSRTGVAENAR
jgi:hypothetical protein